MKNNVIKFTVNPFASLESIMKQVNNVAEGKVIDGIFVERKSFFKTEVEVLVSIPQPIYIDKPVIKEVIKEVPVEVIKVIRKKTYKRKPTVKYAQHATSRYRGVWKDKKGKYRAQIYQGSKKISLGSYTREIDAARAYNKAAIELKGRKAILNHIVGE